MFGQQLALLAGFGLAEMAPGSAEFIHTVVECAKLAFADREAWYGDPRFAEVPVDNLLSAQYAAQRRGLVGPAASADLRPGSPGGGRPGCLASSPPAAGRGRGRLGGEPTLAHCGDTCHLDVADRFGNLVAATPSGGWLQSSPVIPGLGFCLGTRAQMFTLTPGLPNSLAPGKRPRTTLSPGLALRGGEPYLAFGTPGGDQQDQWTLGFFLNHVLFGMNLQEAIDAPAFHTRRSLRRSGPGSPSPGGGGGGTGRAGGDRGAAGPGARGDRVAALVPRPGQRGRQGRRHAVRRGQRPGHAGLRGGPVAANRQGQGPARR